MDDLEAIVLKQSMWKLGSCLKHHKEDLKMDSYLNLLCTLSSSPSSLNFLTTED